VRGIENVAPGRGVELLPSFVAHQWGYVSDTDYPDTSFVNDDIYGDLSIGGKYSISSDVVVEATYNPDFSQIEMDASQVNVNSSYVLSLQEKRPFFQEGLDLFRTNFYAVYTRSIGDPDLAAKASATFGRTSIALMSAHDEHSFIIAPFEEKSSGVIPAGKSYTNMVAVRHVFGQNNHVRALATDRRFEQGGSGTLTSLDGGLRLTKSMRLRGQVMMTHTRELDDEGIEVIDPPDTTFDNGAHTAAFDGESFYGTAVLVGLNHNSRSMWADICGYQRTPTYRADNGYQPRNSDRRIIGEAGYHVRPKATIFHRLNPSVSFGRIWNFDGVRKDEWGRVGLSGDFRFAQAGFWNEYLFSRERLGGIDFDDIWAISGGAWATPSSVVEGGWSFTYGRQIARLDGAMGTERTVNVWFDYRPTDRLLIEPSMVYTESRETDSDSIKLFYSGYIARTRLGYQFSRELSVRLVGEYDGFCKQWNFDPLVTYRINPFSTFYLGATYDYDRFEDCGPNGNRSIRRLSDRQFFMKIQYLFQA
jgi:hypothetical protein